MPHMPAICNTCGTIFNSGIFIEEATNISFKGNKSGPCPSCGGWGSIPDGVFNFIGNVIDVLSAPERTIKELQSFSRILQSAAQNEEITLEQIENEIQEETTQSNSILELLPKTREEKRTDLHVWIGSILMILQILLQMGEEPVQKIEVNNVIEHIYQNEVTEDSILTQKQTSSTIQPNQPIKTEKIGRNAACPCGSGTKYKYCHGQ